MDISYRGIYAMNKEEARKQVVNSYLAIGNIYRVVLLWHTSRSVVRKWVRRFEKEGGEELEYRTKRPRVSPAKTPEEVEGMILEAKNITRYGRKRLAWYLAREGIFLSPYTIRHTLNRNGFIGRKRPRKIFSPAFWAWEVDKPFSLAQADTKDILDKGAKNVAF